MQNNATKSQHTISDEEIIRFYKDGMSQNDIKRKYGVRLSYTRPLLKAAGFNTSGYRRIPAEHENVIRILLRSGITYQAASDATDISFHVIRDIAERIPDDFVIPKSDKGAVADPDREDTFLARFLAGECFCRLCVSMDLSSQEILRCYARLDPTVMIQHAASLQQLLQAEDMKHNTVTSVARKYGISASVVKTHLNT